MGITGLLPFLDKASQKTHISQFSGCTVAIDSYCWLHKGAFPCADKLSMGQQTDVYVHYCMKFVYMLLSHKIKPILVFDGRDLPAKAPTEEKRREARQANRRKAIELMQMGQRAEAQNLLRRSLNITHEMALELIKHCQRMHIDCIVAPYEADAQLAYLNKSGIADVVITEDSDLVLFGCTKVFFKMDLTGNGVLVDQERIHLAMGMHPERFELDKLLHMCILSGCDYLPSLPGIGLGKAKKFIMANTDCDIYQALSRLASYLKMKTLVVTKEYRDSFLLALGTFKYQLVYCPTQRKQVRLNPPPHDITDEQLHHAGSETDPQTAFQLALGNCDPFTFKMLHNYNPDTVQSPEAPKNKWGKREVPKTASIWSKNYTEESSQSQLKKTKSRCSTAVSQMTLQITRYKSGGSASHGLERPDIADKTSEKDMLSMYTSDAAKDAEPENYSFDQTSPILSRRNVFAKCDDKHKTSPSLIKVGRSRINTRSLMRTRRTIIDETIVTESKFFARLSQKENNDSSNDVVRRIDDSSDNEDNQDKIKESRHNHDLDLNDRLVRESSADKKNDCNEHNEINELDTSVCQERLVRQKFNRSHSSNCDSGIVSYESQCSPIPTTSNVSMEVKYNTSTLANSEILEDLDAFVEQCDITSTHASLSKWSNTRVESKLSHDKSKSLNRSRTVDNLVLNTTVGKRRSKQPSPITKQQSLLSMYGFNKRDNLKH